MVARSSACLSLPLALLFLVLGALADPSPATAQKPPGDGAAEAAWCVIRRTRTIAPDRRIQEHAVVRCDRRGEVGAEWEPIEENLDRAAADALRDSLNAGATPAVWCVVRRRVMLAPDLPLVEFSVVRCDRRGEIGAGWELVEDDLTFAAAMAMRASLAASDSPGVWCVVRRRVSIVPDRQSLEHTVVRCDQRTSIGPEWELVGDKLDFATAEALRNALNAADAPAIWCFVRRQVSIGTQRAMQFSVIRCDQLAAAGAGWEVLERDLTFAAASTARDRAALADAPAVWCVIRRFVQGPIGTQQAQFSTVRCDQFGEQVGGLGWELIDGPLPFSAAMTARDTMQAAAVAAASPAPDCASTLPGSVATRGPSNAIVCACQPPAVAVGGRCETPTGQVQAGAPDPGCSARFPRRHPQSTPGWQPCVTQEIYDQILATLGRGQPRR